MLISTPIGPLTLTASERGLTAVDFGGEGTGSSPCLSTPPRSSPNTSPAPAVPLDLPLDVPDTGFRATAQAALSDIAFGQTMSYTDLAAACGNDRAVRAVGSACATNPLPIIRPCHRVLRADGSLGGYRGGPAAKQWLLDHEQRVLGNR
ncbi:methylated-DNA--[protein]-cysteine S-methyltransferase [Corynebacterium suedekumii]|nr:methylated-DNA--[protein]-cysteine S-methyltransferase [Corynebacterium suedekumii]